MARFYTRDGKGEICLQKYWIARYCAHKKLERGGRKLRSGTDVVILTQKGKIWRKSDNLQEPGVKAFCVVRKEGEQ